MQALGQQKWWWKSFLRDQRIITINKSQTVLSVNQTKPCCLMFQLHKCLCLCLFTFIWWKVWEEKLLKSFKLVPQYSDHARGQSKFSLFNFHTSRGGRVTDTQRTVLLWTEPASLLTAESWNSDGCFRSFLKVINLQGACCDVDTLSN